MAEARFEVRIICACGRTTEYECVLGRPKGAAPLPCACGRKFRLQELEPTEVVSVAIDPTGVTDGEIPEEPPRFH